jgi:hypothetical protein
MSQPVLARLLSPTVEPQRGPGRRRAETSITKDQASTLYFLNQACI